MTLVYTTAVTASIPSLDLDLEVTSCTITLDVTRSPYVEATIVIPLPVEAVMETIDPRDDLRVLIEAEVEWTSPADPTQTRTFDLVLHARTIDHVADRVTLRCYSDEALLIDGAPLADEPDTAYRLQPTLSLRDDVIPDVLVLAGLPGTLEAGVADANVEGYREIVNLAINPSGENADAAVGFAHGAGASGRVRASAVTAAFGSYSVRWTAAAGNSNLRISADAIDGYIPCKPGYIYVFRFWIRSSVARSSYPKLRFYSEPGSGITGEVDNAPATTLTTDWIVHTVIAEAPPGSRFVAPFAMTTGNSAGQFHYIDGVYVIELAPGTNDEYPWYGFNYFDGSTNAYPSLFDESWDGDANASISRLTPLIDRSPEATDIVPGVSWWDYLAPHVRANDLRVWCDENRDWRLTEPFPTVAGTVTVTEGVNAIDGEDVVSFQATSESGVPLFFTGVVVRYHWTDGLGIPRERFDFAGTDRKVVRVDVEAAWPGAGRAASILAAAEGRGRTQQLTAVMNLDATPGMALSTDLPSTPEQIGAVEAVTWRWSDGPDHGTMTVRARDLEEA